MTGGGLRNKMPGIEAGGNMRREVAAEIVEFVKSRRRFVATLTAARRQATAGQADVAAVARGCGLANVVTSKTVGEFQEGFLRALKADDLYFILAKVQSGAGDVPAAALDRRKTSTCSPATSRKAKT